MSSAVVVRASTIIYLGLDVHKDSVTIAVLPEGRDRPDAHRQVPKRFREAAPGVRAACDRGRDPCLL
jgi:hypothetical protein